MNISQVGKCRPQNRSSVSVSAINGRKNKKATLAPGKNAMKLKMKETYHEASNDSLDTGGTITLNGHAMDFENKESQWRFCFLWECHTKMIEKLKKIRVSCIIEKNYQTEK